MAEPFRFTTGRWYNKYDPETDRTTKAPAYHEGFTYEGFAYGGDYPEGFTPAGVPVQQSLICSKSTFLLVPDVDYAQNLAGSATGELISWADALSTRGSHFHVGVDMRGIAPENWPVQGRTAWGDIKSNGFVAAPGSTHYTGELYAPTAADWGSRLVRATPELLAALEADKVAYAAAKLKDWGIASGERLPDGAYLYASGYVGGTWKDIPDGGLKHHDELKDLVQDMHVFHGIGEEECRQEWFRLAGALTTAWEEKHFAAHWKQLPAQRLDQEEKENWVESFGLKLPPTPLEAGFTEQQQAYEQRTAAAAGFGPATPPQPDGIYEDPADGISWFHHYLGATKEAQPFDGGFPTDAGNAEAVLFRARYALRHDEEADTWLKRVAGRWVQDADAAREAVTALGKKLPPGCAEPSKDPRYEKLDPDADAAAIAALKRHAQNQARFATAASVNAIAAMMKNIARARSEAWMTVRDGKLDASPEILWAGGVPWDLKGSLHGPVRAQAVDRSEPHLHSAACVPDASVRTELWDGLLDAVWPPKVLANGQLDRSMQQWAVLVLAAGVTGYPRKVVPLLKGDTNRGKSVIIDAIADALGTYFKPLNSKVLDAGSSTHDTVLMELKGTRLTFLDEGIQRGKMATARLKRLVGGSSITANRMRQDPVTFRPTHTLAIALNPDETFSFDDPAIDSRMRLLPCNGNPAEVIAAARPLDYFQSDAWRRERPGVLARLMSAAACLLADPQALDKDRAPVAVQMEEQVVRDEEDPVAPWFYGASVECPEGYPSRELYKAFKAYFLETGSERDLPSETKWGRRMNALIPDDGPHSPKELRDAKNNKLRRRKPAGTGSGGFGVSSGPYTVNSFMGGSSQPSTSPVDSMQSPQKQGANPPEEANPPADSPEAKQQVSSIVPVGSVSSVGYNQTTTTKKQTLPTTREKGTGETHRVTEPTGTPGSAPSGGEPAGLKKDNRPENVENAQEGENRVTPPEPKTPKKPRAKLTDEERAERAQARKAKLTEERARAREEKIAELGGPLVQLPAVVLRDQTIIPVTAETAKTWLQGCLEELSVDVEHSGYQIGHKDYALRLVQLGNEGAAVVFRPDDPEQAAVIAWALAEAKVLHAHSALADLTPLEAAGLGDATMWDKMRDTVILAKLSDPSLCDSDEAGLKALAKALLGDEGALSWRCDERRKELFSAGGWLTECEVTTPVERSGWANVPVCETFILYSAADVMDCAAVARVLS